MTRIAGIAGLLVLTASLSTAQESAAPASRLPEIKALYEAAEYHRALAIVKRYGASSLAAAETRDIAVYQALCLLALGNKEEAARRIDDVVRAEPSYEPSTDLPKRLRSLVDDARVRLRTEIVRTRYGAARELFEAKRYEDAVERFSFVLKVLEGPPVPTRGELADLRVLAESFRTLAEREIAAARAAAASSLPPIEPVADLPPEPTSPPASPPPPPMVPVVVPPSAIRQTLPRSPVALSAAHRAAQGLEPLSGLLELVITKSGAVASVRLTKRIHPSYDPLLLAAAGQWRYEPATRDGAPIEFVKTIEVTIR